MDNASGKFATVMAAIAVLVASAQAYMMWIGRNSHIELNIHHERIAACAGVMANAGPFMANVNSLADVSVAAETAADEPRVHEARRDVRLLQAAINRNVSVLEMIADEDLAKQASSLALDVQNLMNNATGLKNLGEEKYRDLRAAATSAFETFKTECRERLGASGKEEGPAASTP